MTAPFSSANEAYEAGVALIAKMVMQMGYAPDMDTARNAARAIMSNPDVAVCAAESAWIDRDIEEMAKDKRLARTVAVMDQLTKIELRELTAKYGRHA